MVCWKQTGCDSAFTRGGWSLTFVIWYLVTPQSLGFLLEDGALFCTS